MSLCRKHSFLRPPKPMLPLLLLFLTAARCQNVLQEPPSFNESSDVEVEEKMKELRKEMVKFQILSKLKLEQAAPAVQPATEASREMIRLLMRSEEEWNHGQFRFVDSEEKLVIQAKGNGQPCLQHNASFCRMFRYELSGSLNASALDIWIYKLSALPKWVSVSLASSVERGREGSSHHEVNQTGWSKLQLPRIQLPASSNDTVLYSAEIVGQNIEDKGSHRPFLMVTKLFLPAVRQRREVDCNTNESCCLRPLRFSFAEIGFNWVLYPEELEANMCTGKCTMDHSAMRTHYERAMTKVLESDNSLHASLGECWTLCCKPKVLEPVRVIYNDTDGIIHVQYIPELSVKSCGCS